MEKGGSVRQANQAFCLCMYVQGKGVRGLSRLSRLRQGAAAGAGRRGERGKGKYRNMRRGHKEKDTKKSSKSLLTNDKYRLNIDLKKIGPSMVCAVCIL